MTAPDADEFVMAKYFDVQDKVFATEAAQYYLHDYYGFPVPAGELCLALRSFDIDNRAIAINSRHDTNGISRRPQTTSDNTMKRSAKL
ncbi:hypothetical protein [Paenibacillus massiliensis]|uniref:hypothetical protein n=1 Tax=Paenibacillus massiliensis TaxID=225917 RepID=UPI0004B31B5B|nr:hypothetical protein [Paenibacillus massiliensis]